MGDATSDGKERLLTGNEVASLLRVNPRTVSRWARAGKLPSTRTPGGQHRFRESDIQALLSVVKTSGDG